MADDDDEEEDLWGEMEQPDNQLMVSANLASVVGVEEKKVHAGEPDEGQVRWVAPSFSGLSNSDTVDVKGGHWNKDEGALDKKPGIPLVPPTPTTATAAAATTPVAGGLVAPPMVPPKAAAAPQANPTFLLPQSADGRIDWGAMMANSAK